MLAMESMFIVHAGDRIQVEFITQRHMMESRGVHCECVRSQKKSTHVPHVPFRTEHSIQISKPKWIREPKRY